MKNRKMLLMLYINGLKQCFKVKWSNKWGKFIKHNSMCAWSTLKQINLIVRSILSYMGTTKEYGKWIEINQPNHSLIKDLSSFSMELDMHKKKFHSTVSIFYGHVTHCKGTNRFYKIDTQRKNNSAMFLKSTIVL